MDPLAAFHRGDEAVWESVVDENLRWLRALGYRITGDAGEAEDAVQECFIRAYRSRSQLRDWANRRAWLRTICVRLCVKRPRRAEFAASDAIERAESAANLQRAAQAKEELELVMEALDRLAPRQRTCLVLAVFEEMSGREIAESLEISESSVRGYIHEARQNLKAQLQAAAKTRSPANERSRTR